MWGVVGRASGFPRAAVGRGGTLKARSRRGWSSQTGKARCQLRSIITTWHTHAPNFAGCNMMPCPLTSTPHGPNTAIANRASTNERKGVTNWCLQGCEAAAEALQLIWPHGQQAHVMQDPVCLRESQDTCTTPPVRVGFVEGSVKSFSGTGRGRGSSAPLLCGSNSSFAESDASRMGVGGGVGLYRLRDDESAPSCQPIRLPCSVDATKTPPAAVQQSQGQAETHPKLDCARVDHLGLLIAGCKPCVPNMHGKDLVRQCQLCAMVQENRAGQTISFADAKTCGLPLCYED